MKVFISWSGEAGRALAVELRDWLPLVVQSIEPFMSEEDIAKGARWAAEVSGELAGCSYGVICLTPENLNAPWLNFEAGALSKNLDDRVSPVLLGLKKSEVQGPLALFQATSLDAPDIKRLLESINASAGSAGIPEDRLHKTFELAWPTLEATVARLQSDLIAREASGAVEAVEERTATELLEEVVELVRSQIRILKDPEELLPPSYLRRALGRGREIPGALIEDLRAAIRDLDPYAEEPGIQATIRRLVNIATYLQRHHSTNDDFGSSVVARNARWRRRTAAFGENLPELLTALRAMGVMTTGATRGESGIVIGVEEEPGPEAYDFLREFGESVGVHVEFRVGLPPDERRDA